MTCPPVQFWEGLGLGLMLFFGLIGWGVGRYFCARANEISKRPTHLTEKTDG